MSEAYMKDIRNRILLKRILLNRLAKEQVETNLEDFKV